MMQYIVYKTVNSINGKFYIGVHKTDNPNDEYLGSGKLIKRAVAKYGEQNFHKEVLAIFENPSDAFELEKTLVAEALSSPLCYNLKAGGEGGFDWINQNGFNGTTVAHIEEVEKRRQRTIHKRLLTDSAFLDARRKHMVSISKLVSKETQLRSLVHAVEAAKNRQRSAKELEQLSMSHRGARNSQFGTRWMRRDGEEAIKVARSETEKLLLIGWSFGRFAPKPKPICPKVLSLNDRAPEGTKWCFGHRQYLIVGAFHVGQKYCIECRKAARKV